MLSLRSSHLEPYQAIDSMETQHNVSVAVLKHNSSDKVLILFQNVKNMLCFNKALFIALGPVSKSQSHFWSHWIFSVTKGKILLRSS